MEIENNYRKMPSARIPRSVGIRNCPTAPLILVKFKGDGFYSKYAKSAEDKDAVIELFNEATDLLLWSWPGKKSTDVFRLTHKDLEVHYQ